MAAEAAETAHGAEHASGAFPPFDASLFPHQLVWLAVSFGVLYFLMSRVALPRVAQVVETRRATKQNDLDAAAETSSAADKARETAERQMAEARAGARKIVDDMRAQVTAELADDRAVAEKTLADRQEAAQRRISNARSVAMEGVDGIAAELAREIVAKFTLRPNLQGAE